MSASPLPQQNDRVAGALQRVHKCCSGLQVQIMLEMGECKQKMDFGPGNKALCMQILLCYYPEIQPALGADKERTDSSPWGIFIFVLHQRLERSSSFATQLWGQMSVGGTCL